MKTNSKGIPYGIETLKDSIQKLCNEGQGCFNPNGCDHEFYRKVPQDNPNLLKYSKTITKCVSKCFHKYCDKYKWVIERAKQYAERIGVSYEEIIACWEEHRTYSVLNYYQDCNQPPIKGEVKVMTMEEWNSMLRDKFGDNFSDWKFVCPVCGRVQSVGDFERHGIDSNLAYQHCLGRHVSIGKKGEKDCNYTIHGLFCLAKTMVINDKCIPVPVFEPANVLF